MHKFDGIGLSTGKGWNNQKRSHLFHDNRSETREPKQDGRRLGVGRRRERRLYRQGLGVEVAQPPPFFRRSSFC